MLKYGGSEVRARRLDSVALRAKARAAGRQMPAIDALRAQLQARGTLRGSAPGMLFTRTNHAEHDGTDDKRGRIVMLDVQPCLRNNLSADERASARHWRGDRA